MHSTVRVRTICIALAIAAVAGLAAATVADASVVRAASVEQLTDLAGCVVRGRIIVSEARWEGGMIYTRHQIRVSTCLKGNAAADSVVVISTIGGQIGEVGQVCCGEATFRAAEDVYVFLWKDPQGRWRVVGMNQGRFRVLTAPPADDDSGTGTGSGQPAEPTVQNSFAGLVVVDESGQKTSADPIRLTLSAFEKKVRDAVAASEAEGK